MVIRRSVYGDVTEIVIRRQDAHAVGFRMRRDLIVGRRTEANGSDISGGMPVGADQVGRRAGETGINKEMEHGSYR